MLNDVNFFFSANRLRKMCVRRWRGFFDTRSYVYNNFCLCLVAFRIGKMKAKEDNSRGKTWFSIVRDQNGKASWKQKEKCLAFRILPHKPKKKLMGKCFEGLHFVCVRFSGLCSALVLFNLMMWLHHIWKMEISFTACVEALPDYIRSRLPKKLFARPGSSWDMILFHWFFYERLWKNKLYRNLRIIFDQRLNKEKSS